MTTRADIRTRVRDELNDTGATKLWSDGLLDRWIGEGIREWSRVAPRDRTWQTISAANDPTYLLPNDVLEIVRVEHPAGLFRARGGLRDGDISPSADLGMLGGWTGLKPAQLTWEQWAGDLVLIPAPGATGETIEVRYKGAYTVPADDVSALDLLAEDEDALVSYVCARALGWVATDEAKRQRFERQRGADPVSARLHYQGAFEQRARRRRGGVRPRRLVARE
ncbi:MAG: hypothetical protein IT306_27440 [Chloroflexi bacterium]|nr:hypothetical protein [Chloroflexota bacterium]